MNGYLTIARMGGDPGKLAATYRNSAGVMRGVGEDHGLLVHAAATSDEGLVVVNLWPSKEGSESAAEDPRRLEVLAGLNLEPGDFRREHYDVVGYDLFAAHQPT